MCFNNQECFVSLCKKLKTKKSPLLVVLTFRCRALERVLCITYAPNTPRDLFSIILFFFMQKMMKTAKITAQAQWRRRRCYVALSTILYLLQNTLASCFIIMPSTVPKISPLQVSSRESDSSSQKILVVGGNGRVGGSAARHVHILSEGKIDLILGGRSEVSFEESKARITSQLRQSKEMNTEPKISFQQLDLTDDVPTLATIIKNCGANAVVHTAGPFQQRTKPTLLEASIQAGVPYVDVCDEPPLCETGRGLSKLAEERGVVAVTAAGIWPGASALMAAQAVDALRQRENDNDAPVDIKMSFFTAGTGNAGATIVSATFLLLCQQALTIAGGKMVEKEPWTEAMDVDFRGAQGFKTVRLLDNPDVFTLYNSLSNIKSLSSRFATAPGLWNQLFGAMKQLVPRNVLANTDLMQGLSLFSLPIIRAVDKLVGATNAMRVDASSKGHSCTFIVTHDDLEQCVGLATAAFIIEILDSGGMGKINPGVYYPAELPLSSRENILELVKRDAIVWDFDVSQ